MSLQEKHVNYSKSEYVWALLKHHRKNQVVKAHHCGNLVILHKVEDVRGLLAQFDVEKVHEFEGSIHAGFKDC